MVHIYCGDGKGKTTAAIGLALRAAGAEKRVVFLQFLKGRESAELQPMREAGITVLRNPVDYGFFSSMTGEQKRELAQWHNENLQRVVRLVEEGGCDVLVLDEACAACRNGSVELRELKRLLESFAGNEERELVLTGREPSGELLEHADYITEMKKRRHPFDLGQVARRGIEF